MRSAKLSVACLAALSLAGGATSRGQDAASPAKGRESELLHILKSSSSDKDKADACLELARVGTKASVAPLAAFLADPKLSHMARYALEPIHDPAVDDALRDALGTLKGRLLVGVIGSIGVRRDSKGVGPLSGLVKDTDPEVAHAAARALGSIGNPVAVEVLEGALDTAPGANMLPLCEGLLRCAEALSARGQPTAALAIYDRLNQPQAPRQVREGAARRARILRQEKGQTI